MRLARSCVYEAQEGSFELAPLSDEDEESATAGEEEKGGDDRLSMLDFELDQDAMAAIPSPAAGTSRAGTEREELEEDVLLSESGSEMSCDLDSLLGEEDWDWDCEMTLSSVASAWDDDRYPQVEEAHVFSKGEREREREEDEILFLQ